ncbi:hypothetical protein TSYNTROOL_15730 [Tepidanaerobacter syntrophicus]|uniref:immunoglobulin-like domain-containing protein n=1 Tax=Tepidanaerobacter syntrophicus TaxID=224999 RepID=UPI0022ED55A7|nr:immunoglobulin-like domain-containing protein [Tepidanaerobacter syntrophicus]GLI51487.1 hypothetical protein TSYNTROOL_15730 [Tepidanaerobacter syntrophicus]
MKKAKKLLVTLLVFAFVLSTFTVGFAATSSSAKVTDENLPKEVVRAMALGYLKGDDQGNLNLDKPITRAEALAIIIRISGLETSADLMKGQTKFADVNADPSLQWATGYINLGVGQGIINGYPDGTFRGNANVTYAEMAKMLIYAMNYGVTVEGAPWPAGVMGKADDLGLFDDVNASPDVPAIRGDVVMMVDNSLTVAHLKQTGYGDLKQYEEDPDTTFLSKMKIDELEDARVTAIARVDSTLEDDEIELTTYDSKGNVEDSDVYTLLTDETPEALFGLKVDAWINDDDEIVFVDVATNAKDILLDTVKETPAKDEIELKVADDTFDVATGAEAYVNFDSVSDFSKIPVGSYGKFVRESGKIAFANLFDFDKKGIVTEVDKNVISFVDAANGDDDEIDLSDYDDVYVYNPDFSKADVKDIKEYSAIFFWEDDDEINIVVKNDSVEGKVDAVKADSIKIDGTWYDKGDNAIVTLDKGDNYDVWEDKNGLDIVEDFVDEDVTAVLDLNGEVMLVTGAAKATSGDLYGIVTYAKDGRYVTLTVFNKDGEEVDYTAESSTEFRDLVGLDYYATGSNVEYAALKYKLTSDSEIAKEKSAVAEIKGTDCTDAYPANTPTTSLLNSEVFEGNLKKGSDKKNITVGTKTFYIASDTVIMQALNNDGELDPSLITVDKFVSLSIENNNEAVVFGENGKDAKFIVMLNKEFEGAEEDLYYGVVTDKPYKSGGSYYATINVFGEGEKDYKIDDAADFPKAKVVCFKFNNKGEATIYKDAVTNKEYSYDDGYVTIKDNGTYKVDSSAILYSLDGSDIDKKISRTALKDYKYINYVLDDSNVIVAATVSGKATGLPPTPTTGTVTYINDGEEVTDTIELTAAAGSATITNALDFSIKYKAPSDKDAVIKAHEAVAKLYDNSTGLLVTTAGTTAEDANGSELLILKGNEVTILTATNINGQTLNVGKNYTLKVEIKVNDETIKKDIAVIVKPHADDVEAVKADKEALTADVIKGTNPDLNNVTTNLTLPTTGTNGSTIAWTSSNATYVATNGTVTQPAYAVGDKVVTLTATITKGGYSETKEFTVTVKAAPMTDAEAVAADKAALTSDIIKGTNPDLNNVTTNLTLPTTGTNGSTIAWTSSNATYVATNGTVTRPNGADLQVTLTATITKGTANDTKVFVVTVKGQ